MPLLILSTLNRKGAIMVIFLADAVLADRMIVGGEVSLKCARLIDHCASHCQLVTLP